MNNTNENLKCTLCQRPGCGCGKDIGKFLLRFGLAVVFIVHGISKFQNMEGTISFFASLGFGPILAYFIAAVETFSGFAMLFGVFTRWAGYLLAATMFVAILKVRFMKGFVWPMPGKYELDFLLLISSLAVSLIGPGKYSLMKCCCGMCMGKCQAPQAQGTDKK